MCDVEIKKKFIGHVNGQNHPYCTHGIHTAVQSERGQKEREREKECK